MKLTKDDFLFYWKIIKWPIFLIICFCVQWLFMSQYIKQIKHEYLTNIKEINKVEPFYFEFTKSKDKQIVLKPDEFKKMYEHINSLSDKVSEESKRTQEFISQDIERLNLYMAIGIGFIAILGVLIPVLVNILSFDDLKTKVDKIDSFFTDEKKQAIENSIKNADEAIEKSNKAIVLTDKINVTTQKVETLEKSTAKVSTLILQLAIIRYQSIMPYLVMNFEKDKFISIITGIKNGFKECNDNQNYSIAEDKQLRILIADFVFEINSYRTLSMTLDSEIFNSYINLAKVLKAHLKVETKEEAMSNRVILDAFDNLIETTNKFYAKTESTTQQN